MTYFVPKYLGVENISREDIIENQLLASGSNDRAVLLLDGTYITLKKFKIYLSGEIISCLQRSSASQTTSDHCFRRIHH